MQGTENFQQFDDEEEISQIEQLEAQPTEPSMLQTIREQTRHPIAVFFHCFFKISALVIYFLFKWFGVAGFVLAFICVVLLLAADFWTVKNVTGRLLVGLRWWHYVREDGSTVWLFESSKNAQSNAVEAVIFWGAMLLPIPIWFILGLANIFNLEFQWLAIVVVAVILAASNVFGFARCWKGNNILSLLLYSSLSLSLSLSPSLSCSFSPFSLTLCAFSKTTDKSAKLKSMAAGMAANYFVSTMSQSGSSNQPRTGN
ncbi:Golgi apparatus membrane protein TVP23 B [Balamuthia mandrillaris]